MNVALLTEFMVFMMNVREGIRLNCGKSLFNVSTVFQWQQL